MLMGIQMILAVFIISITFGAETEFQRGIILFGSAADRTFMFGKDVYKRQIQSLSLWPGPQFFP